MGNLTPGNGSVNPYLSGSQVYALAVNAGFSQTPQYTININGNHAMYSQAEVATAIAKAESDWNADNEGDQTLAAYGSNGLWQIFSGAHPPSEFGLSGAWSPANVAAIDVPSTNAAAAYEVFKSQGFDAWSTYKSGAYLQYLPNAQQASEGPNPDITLTDAQQGGATSTTSTATQAQGESALSTLAGFFTGPLASIGDALKNGAERIGYGIVGLILLFMAFHQAGAK